MVLLHRRDHGLPEGAEPGLIPTLVCAHAIGTDHRLWDELAVRLASRARVLAVDLRGHGASPTPDGPYAMRDLAADVIETVEALGIDRFAFCGVSLGGAVGQQLALDHGPRLSALVLAATRSSFGGTAPWQERIEQVRREGMGPMVEANRPRWFTGATRAERSAIVGEVMGALAVTDVEGYIACCAALGWFDATDRLAEISTPTLVIAGAEDPTCPPADLKAIADSLPHGRLEVLEGAAHLVHLARPREFAQLVESHLLSHR